MHVATNHLPVCINTVIFYALAIGIFTAYSDCTYLNATGPEQYLFTLTTNLDGNMKSKTHIVMTNIGMYTATSDLFPRQTCCGFKTPALSIHAHVQYVCPKLHLEIVPSH